MAEATCSVVGDLSPLYVEGLVSEETGRYIEEHLKECEGCRERLAAIQTQPVVPPEPGPVERVGDDQVAARIVARGRRKIRRIWAVILVLLGLFLSTVLFGAWWILIKPWPADPLITKAEILADEVQLRGELVGSVDAFSGYEYRIEGADLYVTVKKTTIFSPFKSPGRPFEITIPTKGKIKRVYVLVPTTYRLVGGAK